MNLILVTYFQGGQRSKITLYDELSLISRGYRRQEENFDPVTAQMRNGAHELKTFFLLYKLRSRLWSWKTGKKMSLKNLAFMVTQENYGEV
jgi:hypothetical protein